MNLKHVSIFNLIEIFRGRRTQKRNNILLETHCEQKHLHDFYCDAEKPFIASF